jgi:hypothetical protein
MNIPQAVELKISMAPGQQPEITGPLQDKMLCYAMLEIARDAIQGLNFEQPALVTPAKILPAIIMSPDVRNGR